MKTLSAIIREMKSAILGYWERPVPITVFVPVRIYRNRYRDS